MKKLCSIITLLLPALGLWAQGPLALELALGAGLLAGQGEEIVYRDKGSGGMVSQLLWDMKPLAYLGADASLSWRPPGRRWGLFAGAGVKFGLPGETGAMEDRDWTEKGYPEWLTHYSAHDNATDTAFLLDAALGASFTVFGQFRLRAYLAYSHMSFAWAARGGSFLYPQSTGGHTRQATAGDVVTYRQTWDSIAPGVSFGGAFNRYFGMEVSLKASPLAWCSAEDHHVLRALLVTSDMFGGLFIEPGLALSFAPADAVTVSLSAFYRRISGPRGNGNYTPSDEPFFTAGNMAGSGYHALDVGLAAKLRVF
jgi:outer membrane protease